MKNEKRSVMRPFPIEEGASYSVATPLMPSVVYASESPDTLDAQYEGGLHGYTYSREGHGNADVVAARMDALEGASGGVVTGSGMGAVTCCLMGLLSNGDHVIGGNQLYGRSLCMMAEDLPRMGIETTLIDPGDLNSPRAAIRPNTKMVLVEVVSNPTLRLADIAGIAQVCREHGVLLAVDNTFTTPRGFQPFEHGADIVIQSLTKLLAGHSDALLGYVVAKDPELNTRMRTFAVTLGLSPSPFDCWLAERGMMTFDLRFDRAQATARVLADHLAGLPGVKRVIYPTRPDHPDAKLAAQLLKGVGCNMVSFEMDGGRKEANIFAKAAAGISFAPTLGDVGTTLSHPASSSHRALTSEARAAIGITEGFFRVSVGLEEADQLRDIFTVAIAEATNTD